MQVSQLNNVNVYNLSSGKSLPEWLNDRKKRQLLKQNLDIRRRIELIQEFSMPTAASCIQVSKDENYIVASGVYKPRIKCYDVSQLSVKFERCFDADCVKFQILSDDYSKMVLLQSDRYVEFHAQYGRYYRTRIPRFGRDLVYHSPSSDLYLVGAGPEVYRLNLEQGRFLQPFETNAAELNVCGINPVHQLLAVGSTEGKIECFDPRSRGNVGTLDVGAMRSSSSNGFPSVTALSFRNGLEMGVGLSTGQVFLYDIRSNRPILVKDHNYGLPIKKIVFHEQNDKVISVDSKVVKIWERETGDMFTAIESEAPINDMCLFPGSGLIFLAAEEAKMGIYYIPELGQAPKWCSFLDSLTEELEESNEVLIYDDYKFVTKPDLEGFGLSHLVGTNMLRAYMHGYFMDVRLYNQVKSIVDPFAYDKYRKDKIKTKMEEERANRIALKKQLPTVNRNLAEKLIEDKELDVKKPKRKETFSNALDDTRFTDLFKNPDFQIDEASEEYRLLHPVVSKHEKEKKRKRDLFSQFDIVEGEDDSSDDDNQDMYKEYREQQAQLKRDQIEKQPQLYELKSGKTSDVVYKAKSASASDRKGLSLSEMVDKEKNNDIIRETGTALGSKEVTFKMEKTGAQIQHDEDLNAHKLERKQLRRSAGNLTSGKKQGPKYWKGKKV